MNGWSERDFEAASPSMIDAVMAEMMAESERWKAAGKPREWWEELEDGDGEGG